MKLTKFTAFQLFDENSPDQVVNIIPSGHSDEECNGLYRVYIEDAYDIEPHQTGIRTLSSNDIKEEFGIDINGLNQAILSHEETGGYGGC